MKTKLKNWLREFFFLEYSTIVHLIIFILFSLVQLSIHDRLEKTTSDRSGSGIAVKLVSTVRLPLTSLPAGHSSTLHSEPLPMETSPTKTRPQKELSETKTGAVSGVTNNIRQLVTSLQPSPLATKAKGRQQPSVTQSVLNKTDMLDSPLRTSTDTKHRNIRQPD